MIGISKVTRSGLQAWVRIFWWMIETKTVQTCLTPRGVTLASIIVLVNPTSDLIKMVLMTTISLEYG